MELSKAEGSVSRLEAIWAKGAEITIALLIIPIGYGAWIIIVAEKAERGYNNSLKR